ncbi:hypothetical protein BV133_1791 [Blastochloris viridis]|uniref:Uncharacterized protein n=1 Tax=Blastochloris viridis TaxID=1079 RepID=A0A182D1V4_BLAVI|nr:hypothetical protein BV133_1791 [Blastochloris viridis]
MANGWVKRLFDPCFSARRGERRRAEMRGRGAFPAECAIR